jgi:hypothetical protein
VKAAQGTALQQAKERLGTKFEDFAVPMDKVEFTAENYKRLFPNDCVTTPLGEVKLGGNQYTKLANRDKGTRKELLGAVYQTLSDPIAILNENREDGTARLYVKTFLRGESKSRFKTILSVVVNVDEINVSISTYQRKTKEVLRKIKKPDDIIYEKTIPPSATVSSDVNSSSRDNGP